MFVVLRCVGRTGRGMVPLKKSCLSVFIGGVFGYLSARALLVVGRLFLSA